MLVCFLLAAHIAAPRAAFAKVEPEYRSRLRPSAAALQPRQPPSMAAANTWAGLAGAAGALAGAAGAGLVLLTGSSGGGGGAYLGFGDPGTFLELFALGLYITGPSLGVIAVGEAYDRQGSFLWTFLGATGGVVLVFPAALACGSADSPVCMFGAALLLPAIGAVVGYHATDETLQMGPPLAMIGVSSDGSVRPGIPVPMPHMRLDGRVDGLLWPVLSGRF